MRCFLKNKANILCRVFTFFFFFCYSFLSDFNSYTKPRKNSFILWSIQSTSFWFAPPPAM